LVRAEALVECFYRVEQTLRMFYTKVESFVFGLDLSQERIIIKQVLMGIEQLARSPMESAISAEA
jgi:hypothetical protein